MSGFQVVSVSQVKDGDVVREAGWVGMVGDVEEFQIIRSGGLKSMVRFSINSIPGESDLPKGLGGMRFSKEKFSQIFLKI